MGIWSSSTQLEKTATGAKANPNGTITTAETHGFVAGDVITYEVPSGATPLAGFNFWKSIQNCRTNSSKESLLSR